MAMRSLFSEWSQQHIEKPVMSARTLHLQLTEFNARRLRPAEPTSDWQADLVDEHESRELEIAFVEQERARIETLLQGVPENATQFLDWFEWLKEDGPGQHDRLFPWLAEHATLEQMRWFLEQEIGGEAGFDDLVALTQIRMPATPKLELARNYWDEMGRGHAEGMHGPLLQQVADELDLHPSPTTTVWESLALANLMAALASNRRYAYHAIGALGAVELTAPSRVSLVDAGLRRLGVSMHGRRYFKLHAGLDIRHSEAWNREVIEPLVTENPALARWIAEGALLRLQCGAACFERYRRHLGVE